MRRVPRVFPERSAVSVVGGHPARSVPRVRADVGGAATPARPGCSGQAAVLVGSHDELVAAALPWLEAGLAAGDLTVLSCAEEAVGLLRAELGPRSAGLLSDPRISLRGVRPPDAVVRPRRLLARAADAPSGRLRLLGPPEFGPAPRNWRETQRYESVINRLLADAPVRSLCVYDRRTLSAEAVASASCTHPLLVT